MNRTADVSSIFCRSTFFEIMRRILIATSNAGKLRDFAGAAARHGVEISGVPASLPCPQLSKMAYTFEANARKKAEEYSRACSGRDCVADDSGLEVDALNGAPGVHSARYAATRTAWGQSRTKPTLTRTTRPITLACCAN